MDVRDETGPDVVRATPTDFEVFYKSRADEIYRAIVVTLRDPDLARDATAEGFTRAYRDWSKVATHGNPSGWVYRVALNWATSQLRRFGRVRTGRVPDHPVVDGYAEPGVATAIEALSPNHRAVVVLRFLLEFTQEEIAQSLSIPLGTVKSRLARAMDQLRENVPNE